MSEKRPSSSFKLSKSQLIAVALLLIVIWFCSLMVGWNSRPCQPTLDTFASLGDSMGVINTLFSALGLLGAIYAILQQNENLDNQREDLQLQRNELSLTRQEFESQTGIMRTQLELLSAERESRRLEARPWFRLHGATPIKVGQCLHFNLSNNGAVVYDLEFAGQELQETSGITQWLRFQNGDSLNLSLRLPSPTLINNVDLGIFVLRFRTSLNELCGVQVTLRFEEERIRLYQIPLSGANLEQFFTQVPIELIG